MPDTGIVDAKNLIQINATMIAGILIFYTIPYITAGGPYWEKRHWSENVVLGLIASPIGLFALSAILAFMVTVPFYMSYLSTIGGFIAIAIAAGIFIIVVKIAKKRKMDSQTFQVAKRQTPMAGELEEEENEE
jgi:uncharacterized protein YacL